MHLPASSRSLPRGGRGWPVRRRVVDPLAVIGVLTGRDRHIIEVLAEHQVLTSHQLAEMAFPSRDVAQRRLLRLYQLKVLDRFRWYITAGSLPWHYTLGVVGAELIAAAGATTPPRPGQLRERQARLATSPRLGHLLGVNGFFTALAGHARTHPDTALAAWSSEARCAEHYGRIIRPDGSGVWVEAGRRVEFFLEYDTGTELLRRLVDKLAGYADLARAGGPTGTVLFWLPSTAREANLRDALGANPRVPVATAAATWAAAAGCCPADAIWLPTGASPRRRLAELSL
jgi:Replication-relaxation